MSNKPIETLVYDYTNVDIIAFNTKLKSVNWAQVMNNYDNINDIYNTVMNIIEELIVNTFKLKTTKRKPNQFPPKVKELIRAKRKSYHMFKSTNNIIYHNNAIEIYNK